CACRRWPCRIATACPAHSVSSRSAVPHHGAASPGETALSAAVPEPAESAYPVGLVVAAVSLRPYVFLLFDFITELFPLSFEHICMHLSPQRPRHARCHARPVHVTALVLVEESNFHADARRAPTRTSVAASAVAWPA